MLGKRHFRNVIPSEVEGSFSLAIRGSVPDSEKWETLYRRKGGDGASPKRLSEGGGKRETKKISRCARNDSVENGYLVHHAKKECVGNAFFPYRHPERSRGIFPAHWYSALCETAEKGKPLAKGVRNDGGQGRFLASLEMTVWGEWVYST